MPPPTSPLSLSSFPFNQIILQADFNAGTFGGETNALWCEFITADEIGFGGFCDKGGTFVPDTKVYASDGTTLLFTINASGGNPRSWWFVFAAGTYYVKITRNGGGASDFDMTVDFDTRPILISIPETSFIINDDAGGFPATVMSRDTGQIIGILTQIPAGEIGAIFYQTNESLWQDVQTPFGLDLFDPDLVLVDNLDDHAVSFAILGTSDDDFYFYFSGDVEKITKAGVVTSVVTGTGLTFVQAIAISPDGTIMYYITGRSVSSVLNDGKIKRWDLVNNLPLSDFYTIPGFSNAAGDRLAQTANNSNPGDLLRLADGTFVTHYYLGGDDSFHIIHLDTDGSLIDDFSYTGYGAANYGLVNHLTYDIDNPDSICVWFYKDNNAAQGRYASLLLADGTLTTISDIDLSAVGVNQHTNSNIIFTPSSSCTFVLYVVATTATLTVVKLTVPTGSPQVFRIVTQGGVFTGVTNLIDGGSTTYPNLDPATYSVTEDPVPPGWSVSYEVSNGDEHDDITLIAGDNVTVTVTNTSLTAIGSGIYKLVPGKRNDTIFTNADFEQTTDVAIPRPFGRTALVGD